jgi:hypothetical protein
MVLKQGRNRGLLGPKRSLSCQIHQIVCFQWSYLGCMTQKQGSNWGYRAQNGVIIGFYGLKQGRNWGFWGQYAVKVVKFIKIACFQWS